MHHTRTLGHRNLVPVLVLSAAAVHRVEAEITRGRDLGEKPRMHGFPLPCERLTDARVPFRRVWLNSALNQRVVRLLSGLVQSQFDHREIGAGWLHKVEKPEP